MTDSLEDMPKFDRTDRRTDGQLWGFNFQMGPASGIGTLGSGRACLSLPLFTHKHIYINTYFSLSGRLSLSFLCPRDLGLFYYYKCVEIYFWIWPSIYASYMRVSCAHKICIREITTLSFS